MKTITSIAIAFFLVLSVVPAMAADQAGSNGEPVTSTFQAFSNMPARQLEALTPLTETELASIEGSSLFVTKVCVTCTNSNITNQSNTATFTNIGDNNSSTGVLVNPTRIKSYQITPNTNIQTIN